MLEKTIRIQSHECDFERRIRPAVIFQHLAEIAGEHAHLLGWGFDRMLASNQYWVESRLKIKFFDLPRFGDEITLRTWPKTIQQRLFFIRDFEILSADSKKLAAASSAWLVIDAASRRLIPSATSGLDLPATPDRHGLEEPLEKLGLNDSGEERLKLTAGYSAVDMQGHVNNSRYVDWVCDCFPMDMYRSHTLDWIQVNYDHEILPGEEVVLLVDRPQADGNPYTVEGLNCTRQTRAFECALQWRQVEPGLEK
jgi:acyl-ACP thioesterase